MRQKSLLSSIRFLFLISIPIPFLLIASLFFYFYNNQLLVNNRTNLSNTLSSAATSMEIYIAELNSISNIPYLYPNILHTMDDINLKSFDAASTASNELPAGKEYRVAFLKYMYNSSQAIDSVTFYPHNNPTSSAYILSRNSTNTKILEHDLYASTYWYHSLQNDSKATAFFPEYNDKKELQYFSYTKNIRDVDSKRTIGTIKIKSSANVYVNLLKKMTIGRHSALCLTSEENTIFYNHTNDQDLQHLTTATSLPTSALGYQIISMPIKGTNMQLVYLSSNLDLFSYQITAFLTVLLVTLLSILFSFFIYLQRARHITTTISSIKDSLKQVAAGKLERCEIQTLEKEFTEIVEAVNYMIVKLNEHITNEYKANLAQQVAEHRALQAQINPHFLYNTLNGFVGLNRMGERQLLEQSIIRLTHLFQYTCNSSTTVPLREELSFIRQYLELQSLKYDERLTFAFHCDESTLSISIPKLLLQPLIENAIIHGLEPTDRPIHIQVSSMFIQQTTFGQYLLLLVEDNGIGFVKDHKTDREHIGIDNILKRLTYNNAGNVFHIESSLQSGTRCILMIKQS